LAAKWQNEEPIKVQVQLAKDSGKREESKLHQASKFSPKSEIAG